MANFQIRDPFQFLTPMTGNVLRCKARNCYQSVAGKFRREYQGRRAVLLTRDPRGKDFDQHFYDWTLTAVCSRHRQSLKAKGNEAAAFRKKVNSVLRDMKVVFEDEVSNYLPRIASDDDDDVGADGLKSLDLPYQVQVCVLNSYHKRIEDGRNLTLDHRLEPNIWTESYYAHSYNNRTEKYGEAWCECLHANWKATSIRCTSTRKSWKQQEQWRCTKERCQEIQI